jgi:hypothetical protein
MLIENFIVEYANYRRIGEKAISQVSDEDLNRVINADNNSIAILVRHISGNFLSRFTDFLTSDGEKPWRDRDSEFEGTAFDRDAVEATWARGWDVLESELAKLSDEQLSGTVLIRGEAWTVHGALCRSLAHVAMHVGQIVLLARIFAEENWKWISIPKGKSRDFNKKMEKETGAKIL